ncbi:neuronal acetylcholine receptor subunit alpha-9-I-like [Branchiostoma floridae]|uniref:Neuronal acetylcholine receptor subunit alpha-9-I-like n=1 Tax=Branchiostoma floridae TaxID=7739 RepID=A0A9J7M1Z5_BRAFL|nr:neuronal acetylcholine receptor subunit alpha-9-I-like [Branchiostoma floridae]
MNLDIRGKLEEDLLVVYSPNQAPKTENHSLSAISFNGSVEQIVDLDEKRELLVAAVVIDFTWQDSRLKWEQGYYGDIKTISVSGSSIWIPTLTLKKNADPSYPGLAKDVPLLITIDGRVTWRVETLTSTICDANPFYFPADTMECHICFSVSSAIKQTIECGAGSSCGVWSPTQQEDEWNRKDKIFTEGNKTACFAVHLERIPLFHIATTVAPCVILVVLMTITFVMPIDKGDRISFGVTILLSMVVSLVFVTDVLPVKGALPFFATLIVVCMGLMGLFLFFTIYIISLHDKEGSLSPMAKTFFLHYMARFLLLGDLTQKEATSDDGETGLPGGKPAWAVRTNRVAPAHDMAVTDVEASAQVSETTRQLSGPPTRQEAALSSDFSDLIHSVEELTKAVKNEPEVSDYTLLTKVLDRLCLVLYVISVAVAVPMTMCLGK